MAGLNIVNLSSQYPGLTKGQMDGPPQGLVVHHTATSDTATPQSIAAGWAKSGNSAQYIMGRDGTIYQMVPDGGKANQIVPSWNPATSWARNSTTQGIEIIAKDDSDVTPAQTAALQQFALQQAQTYGYDPATHVIGHGEVNGSVGVPKGENPTYLRQDSEGMTAVTSLRNYLAQNPQIEAAFQSGDPAQIASAYSAATGTPQTPATKAIQSATNTQLQTPQQVADFYSGILPASGLAGVGSTPQIANQADANAFYSAFGLPQASTPQISSPQSAAAFYAGFGLPAAANPYDSVLSGDFGQLGSPRGLAGISAADSLALNPATATPDERANPPSFEDVSLNPSGDYTLNDYGAPQQESTQAGDVQLPRSVTPTGALAAMLQANAALDAQSGAANAKSWQNLMNGSGTIPSAAGSTNPTKDQSQLAPSSPGLNFVGPSSSSSGAGSGLSYFGAGYDSPAYKTPAADLGSLGISPAVNVPKYVDAVSYAKIPMSQPIEQGSGVHWDATLGQYVLDASTPAAPTYTTKAIHTQKLNPAWVTAQAAQSQTGLAALPAVVPKLTLAQQLATMTPAQKANLNPASVAAIQNNQTTYSPVNGVTMPTVAMNGQIRNTYADASAGGNPGAQNISHQISPFYGS